MHSRRRQSDPPVHFNSVKTTTYMADKTTVRLLFAIAAAFQMHIANVHIKAAYLHEQFDHSGSEKLYFFTAGVIKLRIYTYVSTHDSTGHTRTHTRRADWTKTFTAHQEQGTHTSVQYSDCSKSTDSNNRRPTCACSTDERKATPSSSPSEWTTSPS